TVGVTAADRSGLIDAGLPGAGNSSDKSAPAASGDGASAIRGTAREPTATRGVEQRNGSPSQGGGDNGRRVHRSQATGDGSPNGAQTPTGASPQSITGDGAEGSGRGTPSEAAHHGQETAAEHKATGKAKGKTKDHPAHPTHTGPPKGSKGAAKSEEAGSKGKGKGKGKEAEPAEPAEATPPQATESPAQTESEAPAEAGTGNGKGKGKTSESASSS
ncbi:MAG TPA: hypothetical protein VG816_09855, partial [Solirubrobacterales bacterium]|nr:hypothetical protein [Solirubrobacterales bacterium]